MIGVSTISIHETPTEPVVLAETRGHVRLITLNRPDARNALNKELLEALHGELERAGSDSAVGAVVLTGAGSSFCAGADLKEVKQGIDGDGFWSRYDRATASMIVHQLLPRLTKPVVAAVNGYAVAGGCGLAMSSDLVVASSEAHFGYPEVRRGLVPAMVMVSLSRVVGRRAALDLLLSGRLIDAEEALRLGMVNRVVSPEHLVSGAVEYAAEIAENSGSAIRITKALFNQISELDYDRALENARDVNQLMQHTVDAVDGTSAFAAGEVGLEN